MENWLLNVDTLRSFHAQCVGILKSGTSYFRKNYLHWILNFGITGAKQTFVVFAQKIFDTSS